MYKCRGLKGCVTLNQRCDGVEQCANGDDEYYCDVRCPENCQCNGYVTSCPHLNLTSTTDVAISNLTRKLDLSHNQIESKSIRFIGFSYLMALNLSQNQFSDIESGHFVNLTNLRELDMSFCGIVHLLNNTFIGLAHLQRIYLQGNYELVTLSAGSFNHLNSLKTLDLHNLAINKIQDGGFTGLDRLERLNISQNYIDAITLNTFSGLSKLKYLDFKQNNVIKFSKSIFNQLESLIQIRSDDYKFCCLLLNRDIHKNVKCYPPADEFSSCADLIRYTSLQVAFWTIGFVALVGNITSFIIQMKSKQSSQSGQSLIIRSLAISDFLMGVYMIIIASADVHFRGRYIENADQWKTGFLCNLAGVLANVSSEVSVFMLIMITLDRFIAIVFPFSSFKMTKKRAVIGVTISWGIGILLAVIPILPISYFGGKFYSRSGVCLSLHLTRQTYPGWEYSVAVSLALNCVAFLFIAVSYTYMFIHVKRVSAIQASTDRKMQHVKLGGRLAAIVLSDFLCWFPICVTGKCVIFQNPHRISNE